MHHSSIYFVVVFMQDIRKAGPSLKLLYQSSLSVRLIIPDIDECLTYKCGGRCVNLPGSYRCECDKGYRLQGEHCVDEDECLSSPCQGQCVNLVGSYRCECDAGYRVNNHECIGNIRNHVDNRALNK